MTRISPPRNGWVNRVAGEYGGGRPVTLLFDYDGTLTPLVEHPNLAQLMPDTRRKLRELATIPEVRVGVISGRALVDVREKVGLDGVYYAGSGGLELDLRGNTERFPETETYNQLFDAIHDQLLDLLRKFPGTWIERKPGAEAIHYRALVPDAARSFEYEVMNLLAVYDELQCRIVSDAIEVTPANGWHKGTAVDSILTHAEAEFGSASVAVYFGDAANDAEGMRSTSQAGGVAVGVGPDAPSCADVRLGETADVLTCLDELIRELSTRRNRPISVSSHLEAGLLILDPCSASRSQLGMEMAGLGWNIREADTPEAAIRTVRENPGLIRVALIDLQLPGLQGAKVASALNAADPDVFHCFMSADLRPYTARAFGRLTNVPLFTKPCIPAVLDASLRSLIRPSAKLSR